MKPQRILIVEDERITALDLRMTLIDLGHDAIAIASSGEEALELVAQQRPDLVLMDIHLAGNLLGTEAALLIHEQFGTPVVFLTAYTDSETMSRAIASLPYGYLVKPFERREIDAAIQVAVARYLADEEIRISAERLHLALETAHMKVWEWHPELSQALAEPEARSDKHGYRMNIEELLSVVHPDDLDNFRVQLGLKSRLSQLLRLAASVGGEYRWTRLLASVVRGPDQELFMIGILHDVHEEYLAQALLNQANVVFQSSSEGLLVTDADFNVLRMNPAFTKMTGFGDDLLGQQPGPLIYARRHHDRMPVDALPKRQDWSGEIACRRKNGDIFPAWEHISSVLDEQGQVTGYIINIADISELRRAEQGIIRMAFVDSLTGLGNRVRLERLLEQRVRERKPDERLGLLYLDLDGFKRVNDTLGHAEGDKLLQTVAQRLVGVLREEDLVARMGGDEFVIMLCGDSSQQSLQTVAGKVLSAVAEPVTLSRERVHISASAGLVLSTDSQRTAEELLRAADTAMFEAKKLGKNRYCFYDFAMDQEYRQRLKIETDLRQALQQNQFLIGYQPLLSASDGRVCGAEALLRWEHPELGLLLPDRFIPAAEQSELIIEIGIWVLEECCRTLAQWHATGLRGMRLSVNISSRQMADDQFPDIVADMLRRYQLPADQLELEMTETALQTSAPLLPQLERIRRLGVHLAIDDFGTGYSSLGRLKDLPFDRVKIDRSFVRDLPGNPNDVEICKAIMALCRVLHLDVTAEGVETLDQKEMLREMGCECLQGFLYSPALPLDEFLHWQDARQLDGREVIPMSAQGL
ncbi:EAL domain-containing protein [Candidatus Thalassolituus haligoni]|jgi:diguanylate cyclase (GGDEF)-like protein/PAS domain S-box-containing protein|uniref:two-component system response regulator n=1 Tax=Candidatus Thalassolituus haligoni TaxID=3100113 RepID=UPI0035160C90|tara:strand:+ start:4692 stop:7124 length:2433 start_codon:yes stop_codon:yes gene_type:complete